jgi:SAM-dependent methyltransferase
MPSGRHASLAAVATDVDARSYATVFDTVATEYDRHRPTYPDVLIDRACRAGDLAAGDPVLEIGCGTGQLTGSLVGRGLDVTAVEPGANLLTLARRKVSGPGSARFVNRRFEDAPVDGPFRAVFSASAFHWLDPEQSWGKVARSLSSGGLLALLQYFGVKDERTAVDDEGLMAALAGVAPELAADWPQLRDLQTILTGVEQRRENVSDVWAWIATQDVARDYAGPLFSDVEIAVAPMFMEQTADELNALLGTLSLVHRLAPDQRDALERANREFEQRLGRPIRSSLLAVLVTARVA